MYHANQRRHALRRGIFSMWRAWAISVGMLALLCILAPLVTPKWVPVAAVAFEMIILIIERNHRLNQRSICMRLPHVVQLVLLYSAVLLIIVIYYTSQEGAVEFTGQPANPNNPMIPVLVIAPLAMVVSFYFYIRRRNSGFCRACRLRNSDSINHGVMSTFFESESSFQIRLLAIFSTLLTITTWVYYFTLYININLSRSDRWIFITFPVSLYILSLLYLGIRYYTRWIYYGQNDIRSKVIDRSGTQLRYIVVSGDSILLNVPEPHPEAMLTDDFLCDIPLTVNIPYREDIPDFEAKAYFIDASGVRDFTFRRAYVTRDRSMFFDVFHYIVEVTDREKAAQAFGAEWMNVGDLRRLISAKALSTPFRAELHRIHTILMASKTYDHRGFRLYPIKNYRPTFRIRDIAGCDVDYGDQTWLNVSLVNQDKPLFRLRRLWNNIARGILTT